MAHQNLGQGLEVEVMLAMHLEHGVFKVGCLEHPGHVLDFLEAEGLAVLKDNSLADSLHAVLNQEAVEVPVAGLVEVFAVHFGDHELDFKCLAELL